MKILALFLFLFSASTNAAILKIQLSGTIDEISRSGITSVGIGDYWSADLFVDEYSSDRSQNKSQGIYDVTFSGSFTLGSIVLDIGESGCPLCSSLSTNINKPNVPELEISVHLSEVLMFDGYQINNLSAMIFNYPDYSLSNDSFDELENFALSDSGNYNPFVVGFSSDGGSITGGINSVSVGPISEVPLPSSIVFFITALLGFVFCKPDRLSVY